MGQVQAKLPGLDKCRDKCRTGSDYQGQLPSTVFACSHIHLGLTVSETNSLLFLSLKSLPGEYKMHPCSPGRIREWLASVEETTSHMEILREFKYRNVQRKTNASYNQPSTQQTQTVKTDKHRPKILENEVQVGPKAQSPLCFPAHSHQCPELKSGLGCRLLYSLCASAIATLGWGMT